MPRKKPVHKHKLLGTFRPDRHGAGGPDLPVGSMPCPPCVIPEAAERWGEIVAMLDGMGVASPAFSPALVLLVNSLARYIEYEAKVTETGPTFNTANGNQIVSPWWAARNKAWEQVRKALNDFGMSPVSVGAVAPRQSSEPENILRFVNPKLGGTGNWPTPEGD